MVLEQVEGMNLRKEKECFTGRRRRVGIVIITVISDKRYSLVSKYFSHIVLITKDYI